MLYLNSLILCLAQDFSTKAVSRFHILEVCAILSDVITKNLRYYELLKRWTWKMNFCGFLNDKGLVTSISLVPLQPLSLPQDTSKAPLSQRHATIRMVWIKSIFWHRSYSNYVSGRISKIRQNNGRHRWWTMAMHLVLQANWWGREPQRNARVFVGAATKIVYRRGTMFFSDGEFLGFWLCVCAVSSM